MLNFSPNLKISSAPRWSNSVLRAILLCSSLVMMIPSSLSASPIPFELPKRSEIEKISSAVLTTNKGRVVIKLFPRKAPWHVAGLKFLADQGFYRNKRFHLYYPGYIIQGGSPSSNPDDGPGYTLPPEFSDIPHIAGMVGMARKPDIINSERRSNGSQFHILLSDAPRMNGSFTVFGKVVSGFDVVKRLRKGDEIENLVVYVKE